LVTGDWWNQHVKKGRLTKCLTKGDTATLYLITLTVASAWSDGS